MQNKKLLIGLSILAILLLLGGGYYFLFAQKKSQPVSIQTETTQEEVIPTIKPEDVGLSLTSRADKRAVMFEIGKIKDISAIDYELTYNAKGNIPRGTIGTLEVKPGDTKLVSKYIDLGTCSSGKCKYDEGVASVKLLLKITKTDGKTYSSEKSLDL